MVDEARMMLRALVREVEALFRLLAAPQLAALAALFGVLLFVAAQAPLAYSVDIGREDGVGGDLPTVAGFYPPEVDVQGSFRWTRDRSQLRMPGVGVRPARITLRTLPISPEVVARGPQELELWAGGELLARLPVRPAGSVYRVAVPAQPGGDLLLELRSPTFIPTGDERSIGAPLSLLRVTVSSGPALPAWRSTLLWILALLPAWLAVRRAGVGVRGTTLILAPLILAAALAALLDPPRFAFGAPTALLTLSLGLLLVLLLCAPAAALLAAAVVAAGVATVGGAAGADDVAWIGGLLACSLLAGGALRPAIARLYARLAMPPIGVAAWRILVLFALLVFCMRLGGKLYPDSMPGDIGFHANRYADVARGRPLLISRNRGVDFPYPPALYLTIAPAATIDADMRLVLRIAGASLDALSPLLVYAIATALRGPGRRPEWSLAAAGIYSFSASGSMTTWWNFSTHIFTQFTHLLLVAALALVWPHIVRVGVLRRGALVGALVLLQLLVYLGHFGFWMNMSLLGAIGLAGLLAAAWREQRARAAFGVLLASFAIAQAFAALFFYSGYTALFLAQAQATASGGLTGLAARTPVDRAVLWETLWDAGLRVHFGFFPVPLALCGMFIALRAAPLADRRTPILALMGGTFVIAAFFAALPFLSGSTLSTRWLMFSAWAIAIGAALAAERLWRSGRAGRVVVAAAGGYTLAITIAMWIAALAWRVRPPEPF
jgi:hypothetical protein